MISDAKFVWCYLELFLGGAAKKSQRKSSRWDLFSEPDYFTGIR
jgi:hypothetical protein